MRSELPTEEIGVAVRQLRWEADGVVSVHLQSRSGELLPAWEPGAHIDLLLPTGIQRQYSLCGPVGERSYYRIGVRRERTSRGGSEYVHAFLRPGQQLTVTRPRNTFELHRAASYVFVAGGIGITPILPMVRQAESWGRDWKLLYGGRTAAAMPFSDELRQYGTRVNFYASDTDGRIPVGEYFADVQPGAKIYACGPSGLLSALEDAGSHWPADSLHFERFQPRKRAPSAEDQPVEVVCAASGKTVNVEAGQSILAAIEGAGISTPSSCRSGICGACETAVIDGVPDHRDDILSGSERTANDRMFICVSRAQTSRLVLDL